MQNANTLIDKALAAATDTKSFIVGPGALERLPELFAKNFSGRAAVIADPETFNAAGRRAMELLTAAGTATADPLILPHHPHADDKGVAIVRRFIESEDVIPVAAGSGTVNDLCKRASEETSRPYCSVATAASVDGYASFGAALRVRGFKQTLPCAAPRLIIADTEILSSAPFEMTASGYADLMAKIPAGADWIMADAVGADPILPNIWEMTQTPLRGWLADPEALAGGSPDRMSALFEGLALTGFAMQATHSSRPASGAEHLFSHIWEMGGVTAPDGSEPSHGCKVGIGTICSTRMMERVFSKPFTSVDAAKAAAAYPDWSVREKQIYERFGGSPALDRILSECRAKHLSRDGIRGRLDVLAEEWEDLTAKVFAQIIPSDEIIRILRTVGCPAEPEEIGVPAALVADAAAAAQLIRSRYTILDLAFETGRFEDAAKWD